MSAPLAGVYVHVPFCASRCTYCDFAIAVGRDDLQDAYVAALEREIREFQRAAPRAIDTIYVGGGTPSRLSVASLERVLRAIGDVFEISPDAEVTLEANPEDVDAAGCEAWRRAGVTRLSLGVQSLDDRVLRSTGRRHDASRPRAAVGAARRASFEAVSVDLIAGLPGERLTEWGDVIARIADLAPDHVSVYLLETDKDSTMARDMRRGAAAWPDPDALADAYEETADRLIAAGYAHYEISNFARSGHRSRHNVKYWSDAPYAAFGLGAHAYFDGARRANTRDLDAYLSALSEGRDPVALVEPFHPVRRLEEALFMGLRLADGIVPRVVASRYLPGACDALDDVWARFERAGRLERHGARVALTRSGMLGSNALFVAILEALEPFDRLPAGEEEAAT